MSTIYGARRDTVKHSPDLETILEHVQKIADEVVAAHAEETDSQARWPEESIRALQKSGLGGLTVSEEFGGLGQGSYSLAQVCEILGQECPSTAMCFGMHCVGAAVLAAKATKNQLERYLTPIVEGRHLTSLSLTEAGTGAHFYIPRTRLEVASPETYRVSGEKTFVTNGGYADSYLVSTVAADPKAPAGQFSCIVISKDAEGIKWGEAW